MNKILYFILGVHCESGNVNPHKYLLFKPSACQVVTYVASTINELPKKGVLLIFISADGYHPHQNTHPENCEYIFCLFFYNRNRLFYLQIMLKIA